jgi:hypothetical protein
METVMLVLIFWVGRIAVRVINHLGDEVMKVFRV